MLRHFSIIPIPRKPMTFVAVYWQSPLPGWIKVNTDSSAQGMPLQLGGGAVFRNIRGMVHGCFAMPFYFGLSFDAVLQAAMHAISMAWINGWTCLWLKTDSTYVVHLLRSRSFKVSWILASDWATCLQRLYNMEFWVSHIHREGNSFVDRLAREGTLIFDFRWWNVAPDFCNSFYAFGSGHQILCRYN